MLKRLLLDPARRRHLQKTTTECLLLSRNVLQEGNDKLSKKILTFGLPVIATCPGASDACKAACYASRGHYCGSAARLKREENFVLANRKDFDQLVLADLRQRKQRILRPHDSGDFFSLAYVQHWIRIAAACAPWGVQLYAYTRSWRDPELRSALVEFARKPNVRLWYSTDAETGIPVPESKKIRLAYMQVSATDLPARPVDLVFRDYSLRSREAKRVDGSLVCPYENGVTRVELPGLDPINCYRCGLCWDTRNPARDPRQHKDISYIKKRKALPLVATSLVETKV